MINCWHISVATVTPGTYKALETFIDIYMIDLQTLRDNAHLLYRLCEGITTGLFGDVSVFLSEVVYKTFPTLVNLTGNLFTVDPDN